MFRVLGLMLLAGASVANAGEHYVEVWNPPEARQAPHAVSHATHKPTAHRVSANRAARVKPSHVIASGQKPPKRIHEAHSVSVNAAPQVQDLPPLLTPEGNVLRVGTHGAQPQVAH